MSENLQNRERTGWFTAARVFAKVMTTLFFPIRYHGLENAEQIDAPFILIANHRHWMDPMTVGNVVNRYETRWLGKKEIGQNKIARYVVTKLHMIMVDRHNTDLTAMRESVKTVRDGHVLGIFPEGTRCKGEPMAHLETGAAYIALRCKAPLLPVFVEKPLKLWKKTNIYIGKPFLPDDIYRKGSNNETADELLQAMREHVLNAKES